MLALISAPYMTKEDSARLWRALQEPRDARGGGEPRKMRVATGIRREQLLAIQADIDREREVTG